MQPVRHGHVGLSGKNVTLLLKCGHVAVRPRPAAGRMLARVHCQMCDYLNKERDRQSDKRAAKKSKKELRRLKQQRKLEAQMEKKKASATTKKMASAKVAKKAAVVKKSNKTAKGQKHKPGRKWFLPEELTPQSGSVVEHILAALRATDEQIIGENDLLAYLIKAGVKDQGKKTVKKQMKAALRNMSRAGVIVKDRGRKKDKKIKESKAEDTKSKKDEDEDEEEEEETPTPKKKVILKKKAKK